MPDMSGLVVAWKHVDGDPGLLTPYSETSSSVFHSGAVFAGRFFIAGTYSDADFNVFPGIWSSSNGRTWELADIADLRNVSDLVAGPGGLLAVGDPTDEPTPLWLTTNGSDWAQVVDTDFEGQRISRVDATDEGFVAVGTHMWFSADGLEWQATASGPQIIPGEIVRHGDQYMTVTGGLGSGGALIVWTSTDLMQWFAEMDLPHSRKATDIVLAAGPLGWIVAGHSDPDAGEVGTYMWFSTDGRLWAEVAHPVGPVSDLFVDDAGFIAVGFLNTGTGCALWEGDIQGFTWTSLDGQTWAQMPLDGFVGARVDQLLRDGRTLFGIGARYDEEVSADAFGSVWTARLPQLPPAGPAPTAAPTPTPEPGGCGPD